MSRLGSRISACCGAVLLTAAVTQSVRGAEPVDVELVLAVDVSLSMSPGELEIQRRGYAAALIDRDVLNAIAGGAHGRIAVTYFEWAGSNSQTVIVPWTIIARRDDAEAVAQRLAVSSSNSARRTSISAALQFGADLFAESPYRGMKRVIDISGDGPNNQGAGIVEVRDALVEQGIVINGLPLMTGGGFSSAYDVANLDDYYSNCVIGGPGAFMVPVDAWGQFPEAIRRKLVLELAATRPAAIPAQWQVQADASQSVDCMIGEKMWRDRSFMWDQN